MDTHSIQQVAHLRENPDGTWDKHDLHEHLIRVAEKAASFADEFGNGDWVKAAQESALAVAALLCKVVQPHSCAKVFCWSFLFSFRNVIHPCRPCQQV